MPFLFLTRESTFTYNFPSLTSDCYNARSCNVVIACITEYGHPVRNFPIIPNLLAELYCRVLGVFLIAFSSLILYLHSAVESLCYSIENKVF